MLRTLQRVDSKKMKWEQWVKMGLANVRSAKRKTEEIIHNIVEEELDLSFICETWIDNDDSVTKVKLKTELLSFKGNKQIGKRRRSRTDLQERIRCWCTGIGWISTNWILSLQDCYIWETSVNGAIDLQASLFWGAPSYGGKFLDEFSDFISQYINKHPNLIIMEDVNIHNEDDDINRQNYIDMIDTFGYNQVVTIPTHQDGHTLDHLLIPNDCNVEFTNPE